MSDMMQESGIEWIGQIPQGWEVRPIKFSAQLCTIPRGESDERSLPYVALEHIQSFTGKLVGQTTEPVEVDSNTNLFDSSMILFGKLRPYLTKVFKPDRSGHCSTEFLCIRPVKYSRNYLFWLLLNGQLIQVINAQSYGVKMPRTSWSQLGQVAAPVPPISEQEKISEFLDCEVGKADHTIELISQQIETLMACKKSLIYEVVTKGLDPSIPVKPSGVEWIGDIPSHWRVTRVKYIAPAWNGLTYDPADVSDTGTPVLRSGNIQNGLLDLRDLVHVSGKVPEKAKAHTGDILICSRNGSRHLIGKNALVRNEGFAFGAFMMIARPRVSSPYFHYLLNSGVFDFYLPTYLTSTVNQLTGTNFGNMVVPIVDDPVEQDSIVRELDRRCAAFDSAIAKKRTQLSLLEQHKKSLIFEYVTGKRRVSEVA